MTFARDRNLEREAVVDERTILRDALERSMGEASLETAERYLRELEAELAASGTNIDQQASRHREQLERQIGEARKALQERQRRR